MPSPLGKVQCVKKATRRGDHWSSADFATQNLSPQGEKHGYFPSENPKNSVFRRTSNARPYICFEEPSSLTVWPSPLGKVDFSSPVEGDEKDGRGVTAVRIRRKATIKR